MSEKKKETENSKKRRLQTAWRDELICPICHGSLEGVADITDISECPLCGKPISARVRTKTEYLVLA